MMRTLRISAFQDLKTNQLVLEIKPFGYKLADVKMQGIWLHMLFEIKQDQFIKT